MEQKFNQINMNRCRQQFCSSQSGSFLSGFLLDPKNRLWLKKRHCPLLHLPHHQQMLELGSGLEQSFSLHSDFFDWFGLVWGVVFGGFRVLLEPWLSKMFKFSIVQFFSKILFEVFFEFGDGLELKHELLVMASALSRGPICKMSGQWLEYFLGSEIRTIEYFRLCLDEKILAWKSIKRTNLRFWSSSHLPSAIYIGSRDKWESAEF